MPQGFEVAPRRHYPANLSMGVVVMVVDIAARSAATTAPPLHPPPLHHQHAR